MSKMVIAAVLFLGMAIGVLFLLRDTMPDPHSRYALWQSDLRTVANIVFYYAEDHQGVLPNPNSWYEVMEFEYPEVEYPDPVFGENDQENIWMCPIPWKNQRIPDGISKAKLAKIPMLHEKPSLNPQRTSVVFWDGSIRWLSNEAFAAMVNVEDSVCLGCQLSISD